MSDILLVEPDRLLAETYYRALTAAGHQVMACASAQAAIMAADQRQPDLVILEVQLIEHSGIEFLYEFRSYSEWQDIPVLLHSNVPAGEFSGSWQLLRQELGVETYLYKPLTSLQTLFETVQEAINHVIPAKAGN